MNVLITCANSPIMNEVIMHIRRIPQVETIVLADAEEICFNHGCAFSVIVPRGDNANYAEEVKGIITKYSIGYLFICSDEEALTLSKYDWARNVSHIDSYKNVSLVLNKLLLHDALLKKDPQVVPYFQNLHPDKRHLEDIIEQYDSLILRPIIGRGSRGLVHIVKDSLKGEFTSGVAISDFLLPSDSGNYFLTEYISGDKYSADCLFVNGVLASCMIRNNGRSVKYKPPTMFAETSTDKNVFQFAARIGQLLELNGFHQIECAKKENNAVKLIEINPRLDATLPITACYSENFYEIIMRSEEYGLLEPQKKLFKRFYITSTK